MLPTHHRYLTALWRVWVVYRLPTLLSFKIHKKEIQELEGLDLCIGKHHEGHLQVTDWRILG